LAHVFSASAAARQQRHVSKGMSAKAFHVHAQVPCSPMEKPRIASM